MIGVGRNVSRSRFFYVKLGPQNPKAVWREAVDPNISIITLSLWLRVGCAR